LFILLFLRFVLFTSSSAQRLHSTLFGGALSFQSDAAEFCLPLLDCGMSHHFFIGHCNIINNMVSAAGVETRYAG